MKRMLVVGGSVGVGVLLVLAMLTSVVSAQAVKSDEKRTNVFQQIKEKMENNWVPGDIISSIFLLIIMTIMFLMNGGFSY